MNRLGIIGARTFSFGQERFAHVNHLLFHFVQQIRHRHARMVGIGATGRTGFDRTTQGPSRLAPMVSALPFRLWAAAVSVAAWPGVRPRARRSVCAAASTGTDRSTSPDAGGAVGITFAKGGDHLPVERFHFLI